MNPNSKKIIGGVLVFLFIVSIVQTQAIVKIAKVVRNTESPIATSMPAEDQTAQVSLSSAACLQSYSIEDDYDGMFPNFSYDNDAIETPPYGNDAVRHFYIFVKVKNRCNYDVAVVDDAGYPFPYGLPALSPAILEDQVTRQQATGITYQEDVIWRIFPNQPSDINVPISGVTRQSLDHYSAVYPDFLTAYTIPAGESQMFIVGSTVSKYDENLPQYQWVGAGRLAFKKLRWFKASDINDNLLTANEVKTHNVSNANKELLNTSFTGFNNTDHINGGQMQQGELNKKILEQGEKYNKEFKLKILKSSQTR